MNADPARIDPLLNLQVCGKGPDLVLLHGWGLNLRVWDRLTEALESAFRLIAVDLPGHGRSAWTEDARDPMGLIRRVHEAVSAVSTRYSLLGWSLGGQLALQWAASRPSEVERLILVATTPLFSARPDWPHGMAPEVMDRFSTRLATDYRRTVSEFLELQVRGSAGSVAVLEALRSAVFSHGEAAAEALVAGLDTLARSDLRPLLPGISTPALVLAGQYDRVTPPSASRALAEALPDARYVEFRRAAHAPFLSHPDEFVRLVVEFMEGERRP